MSVIETGKSNLSLTQPTRFGAPNQQLTYQSLTGDHYQQVRQLVVSRFEQADQFSRSQYEKFYRFEKLIHMVSKKKILDWKANAFLPYAFSTSEQSAAMKWLSLFLARPYVTVQARVPGLDEIALRRQALLDWHFTSDVDILDLAMAMFRVSDRYGTSICGISPEWDTKEFKYRTRDQLPTALGPLTRQGWKNDVKRNYKINAFLIDNTDFRPQPGKTRINGNGGMRYCFRTYNLTLDELRNLEQAQQLGPAVGGQSVEDIKDTTQQDMSDYKRRRLFLNMMEDVETGYDMYDKNVELIESPHVVPMELVDPAQAAMEEANGLDPTRRMYVIANRKVVLEDIALPWDHGMFPYIKMDCTPEPYAFWGKGKVEPIEHLCYVANEITNMRLDNVKQLINRLIGVDKNKMPPGWKRNFVSQPGGAIETLGNPRDIIQSLELGDVTASAYTEQQAIFTSIQEASAVNETMMGAPGPSRTLGEHVLKAESASKRMQYELAGQAKQLLGWPHGLSKFIIGLDRQYLPLPTYFRVIQPDTPDDFTEVQADPQLFQDEDELFAYLPTGATEGINIQSKRQDLAAMLQALQPFMPMLLMQGFDVAKLAKNILKTFGQDPTQYFPKMVGTQEIGMGAPGVQQQNMPQPGFPGQMPGGQFPGSRAPGGRAIFPGEISGQPSNVPGISQQLLANPQIQAAVKASATRYGVGQ